MRYRRRTLLGAVPMIADGAYPRSVRPIIRGPFTYCPPGDVNPPPGTVWDPVRCIYAPVTPVAPPSVTGTPVPAGFPTNQLFMAPDGSQWAYSTAQGQWINVGTPYDLSVASNPPPASTSVPPAVAPAPVSVTVSAPAPAPTSSPYQTILDFATQSSLITGIPNWLVGVGVLLGFKVVEGMSGGRRRNPSGARSRRRRR